jgi:hypothetical protein
VLLEEDVREVLVVRALHHLGRRQEDERAELVVALGEHELVGVGQRDDEVDVVLGDELGERRDVGRVGDGGHERVAVGRVERRRERVDVHGDGGRAGSAEGADDVHAPPDAGEEHRRHSPDATSASSPRPRPCTSR